MTRRGGGIWLAAGLAAVTLAALPRLAVAAGEDPRDEVVHALDARPERTDFVILLDTSGSMARHFEAVRRFAARLVLLARPGDTVSLLTFAERAAELLPTTRIDEAGRAALVARIGQLSPPRGRYTDLGAGLEATLDALLRPGYAPVSLVFLVTDFCAEPPPGSRYAGELLDGGPCRDVALGDLRRRSKQLYAGGDQHVRAFALAVEPSRAEGYAAATEVLGTVVRADASADGVAAALAGLEARLRHDRAALALEVLLAKPQLHARVTGRLALQGPSRVGVRIEGNLPLPATLRLTGLTALDGSVRFTPPAAEERPRELAPGVPFSGWSVRAELVPSRAPAWSPEEAERALEVELRYTLEVGPRDGVEKLLGRRGEVEVAERVIAKLPLVLPETKDELVRLEVVERELELEPGRSADVELTLTSTVMWADLEARCRLEARGSEPSPDLSPGGSAGWPGGPGPREARGSEPSPDLSPGGPAGWPGGPGPREARPSGPSPGLSLEGSPAGEAAVARGDLGPLLLRAPREGAPQPVTFVRRISNDAPSDPWRLARDESRRVTVSGACTLVAVAAGGARVPLGERLLSAVVVLRWREGVSLGGLAGGPLLLGLLLLVYLREVRPRRAPPALTGRLVLTEGPGDFRRFEVSLRGRRRLELIGTPDVPGERARTDGDRVLLPGGAAAGAVVVLEAEKVGKKSVMKLSLVKGEGASVNDQPLSSAPALVRRGRARLVLGDYRGRLD